MTRARRTLAATASAPHRFLDGVGGVLTRKAAVATTAPKRFERTYQMPALSSVDLSYAGRLRDGHPLHEAVTEARIGDALRLEHRDGRWRILDMQGRLLGRMARAWAPPGGARIAEATVGAVVRWRKVNNEARYQDAIRRDAWETVLPEIAFETGPRRAKAACGPNNPHADAR